MSKKYEATFRSSHTTHCCALHGCKYGHKDCPVEMKLVSQEFPCIECPDIAEAEAEIASLQAEVSFLKELKSKSTANL